jgi:exodeoxyribonuclease (lambda-induced)
MVIHSINRDEDAIEELETDILAFAGLVSQYEAKLRAALAANAPDVREAA